MNFNIKLVSVNRMILYSQFRTLAGVMESDIVLQAIDCNLSSQQAPNLIGILILIKMIFLKFLILLD